MLFPKEFIQLQFIFADKVSKILGVSFQKALFDYTSMPIRVGVPFSDLNEKNQNWKSIVENISTKEDYEKAYEIHYKRMKDAPPMRMQYGCFSFDYLPDEKLVKLHFANNDKADPDVLSDANQPKRREELRSLLAHIKNEHPEAEEIISSSWLYNIEKFKRLFPNEFFENTTVQWDFRSLGIWGQFIDKYGRIKTEVLNEFIIKASQCNSLDELKAAFSLKDLKCWSSITCFYNKYFVI